MGLDPGYTVHLNVIFQAGIMFYKQVLLSLIHELNIMKTEIIIIPYAKLHHIPYDKYTITYIIDQ